MTFQTYDTKPRIRWVPKFQKWQLAYRPQEFIPLSLSAFIWRLNRLNGVIE